MTADTPAPDIDPEKPQSRGNSDQRSQRANHIKSGSPKPGSSGPGAESWLPNVPTLPAGDVKPSRLLTKERATSPLHGAQLLRGDSTGSPG